jgi:molybdate transport system substrate-binding protein
MYGWITRSLLVRFLIIILVVCSVISSIIPAHGGEVRVFVASSIHEAYGELASTFEQKSKGIKVLSKLGTSQTLARQIATGAPADIFISAHQQWTDFLKINGLLEDLFLETLASNSLVFIGKPELKANGILDLRSMKRIAIGNPATTAHGQFTMEAIRNAGLESQIKNNLIMGDAQENLKLVERGEVDGAIMYRTEVKNMKKTKILFTISPELHSTMGYQLVLTKTGVKNRDAIDFYKFLNNASAKAILIRHGFLVK